MCNARFHRPRPVAHGLLLLLVIGVVTGCGQQPEVPSASVRSLPSPAGDGSAEPHLAQTTDGAIVLSWLEPVDTGLALRYSLLVGDFWQQARTVASGEDWLANWADFPSVTPITENLWAAHWLVKRPGGSYAYDVALALSEDGGRSWGAPLTPHDDNTESEHGFVSLFPWQSGVGTLWLDGRDTVTPADDRFGSHGTGSMTLRSAVIAADGDVVQEHLIDSLVCDCCQTDVAVGPSGPIAVYRNRTDAEIRDVYVTRALDGTWEEGRPVADDGWQMAGCPVNGPAVTARDDAVAVVWFTASDDRPRVVFSRSRDGARSFGKVIEIDAVRPFGRVDVVLLDDGDAVVSWMRPDADEAEICVRRVTTEGETGPIQVLARTGASSASGFPQLEAEGDDLVLAWTDTADNRTNVRTGRVAAAAIGAPNSRSPDH